MRGFQGRSCDRETGLSDFELQKASNVLATSVVRLRKSVNRFVQLPRRAANESMVWSSVPVLTRDCSERVEPAL